jgi:hypothetical protein
MTTCYHQKFYCTIFFVKTKYHEISNNESYNNKVNVDIYMLAVPVLNRNDKYRVLS